MVIAHHPPEEVKPLRFFCLLSSQMELSLKKKHMGYEGPPTFKSREKKNRKVYRNESCRYPALDYRQQ